MSRTPKLILFSVKFCINPTFYYKLYQTILFDFI